jgi:DNA-binding transcriptional LysR family regulator
MNFDRLNTFLVAADDLNFTQAARRLHLSQPAVSQQIRELEDDLGVGLFERRGRGLLLTAAGEKLRAMALPLMRDLKQVEVEMSAFQGSAQGVLRVGATNTPGIYLLPYALGRFAAQEPGTRASLQVSDTDAIMSALLEGDLDLAVIEEEPAESRLQGWNKVPFVEDEMVLITPPDHPWAKAGRIRPEQLSESPFIGRSRQSSTFQMMRGVVREAGLDPDSFETVFELGNTEGIKRAVQAGLGVGFASRYALALETRLEVLSTVAIDGFAIRRPIWLVKPTEARTLPHVQRFCDMLLDSAWWPEDLAPTLTANGRAPSSSRR